LLALTTPPYEVSESGWGEFSIKITVSFIEEAGPKAQPVEFLHHLKLFPPQGQHPSTAKPVSADIHSNNTTK
jgi:transcription initiation factor IIF auxiliary subunit